MLVAQNRSQIRHFIVMIERYTCLENSREFGLSSPANVKTFNSKLFTHHGERLRASFVKRHYFVCPAHIHANAHQNPFVSRSNLKLALNTKTTMVSIQMWQ